MSDEKMQRVLITGGGSGIGFSVAEGFSALGAKVCLMDLNVEKLEEAKTKLAAEDRTLTVAGSVTNENNVEDAITQMVDRFGGVDCVVTSAGIVKVEPALEASLENFRQTLEINVTGSWITAQRSASIMTENGGGSIIFIGSVYGSSGAPLRTAYCASKGAVHNLTKSLAVEWGPLGIRVNAVAPTGVQTPMVQELIDSGSYNMTGVKARTPLGRLAEPDEIANACIFLASDKAAMINGAILPVDGGWLANGYTTTS